MVDGEVWIGVEYLLDDFLDEGVLLQVGCGMFVLVVYEEMDEKLFFMYDSEWVVIECVLCIYDGNVSVVVKVLGVLCNMFYCCFKLCGY